AVNPVTGFFKETAKSYWSTLTDGFSVGKGGAAAAIPAPASRTVYTYLGVNKPTTPPSLESFDTSNAALTDGVFGLGTAGDPTASDLIDWARGEDVRDLDPANGNNTETRHIMGDPIHAQPTVVIYGGTTTTPNLNDAAVYVPTNDGYLHATDVATGQELWSYIPKEVLPQLKGLYQNQTTTTKQYALDGELRVLKYDVNGDGIINSTAGDRVILYFGMGRGGSRYYALDVTAKNAPKFLWSIDQTDLPQLGQAWSTPVIARVNVSDRTQNSQKLALVIGGGYDSGEDGAAYVTFAGAGNRVFIVDALSGSLLWSAGSDTSSANLRLTRMDHSIPASVSVLDTNSDGFADRMYVGDTAAQLWRFDITNGNPQATLVAGGVIASLGSHDITPHIEADSRRFYNTPDVAAIQQPGFPPFLSIAIGSGYRGHPLNKVNQDRFYALRDFKPFTPMTQADYNAVTPATDAILQDITTDVNPTIPVTSIGWKLLLNQPGNSWQGEKVLSSSNTFDGMIFFTTYRPSTTSTSSCTSNSAGSGTNRAFTVNAFDGSPIRHENDTGTGSGEGGTGGDDDDASPEDRYVDLRQGGIAPKVTFLFPEPNKIICLSGVEILSVCTNFNSRVKTYWRDLKAN
ncbi:MAG TPA: PilC/PilY family type IV pilus protein, partial [Povalibacter sp.]